MSSLISLLPPPAPFFLCISALTPFGNTEQLWSVCLPHQAIAMTKFTDWRRMLRENNEKWQGLAKLQGGLLKSTSGLASSFHRYDAFFTVIAVFAMLAILRTLWRGRRQWRCLFMPPNHVQLYLGVKFHLGSGTYLFKLQELPYDRNVLPKQYATAPTSQSFSLTRPFLRHVVARWDAPLEMTLSTGETTTIQLQGRIQCPLGFRLPLLMGLRRPHRTTLVVVDGALHYALLPRATRVKPTPRLFSTDTTASGLPLTDARELQPPFRDAARLSSIEEEEGDRGSTPGGISPHGLETHTTFLWATVSHGHCFAHIPLTAREQTAPAPPR